MQSTWAATIPSAPTLLTETMAWRLCFPTWQSAPLRLQSRTSNQNSKSKLNNLNWSSILNVFSELKISSSFCNILKLFCQWPACPQDWCSRIYRPVRHAHRESVITYDIIGSRYWQKYLLFFYYPKYLDFKGLSEIQDIKQPVPESVPGRIFLVFSGRSGLLQK